MQVDDGGVAGGLGVAFRHADHGGLLQAEDVAEVVRKRAKQRQLGRAGIAEHGRGAERAQQLQDGVAHGGGRSRLHAILHRNVAQDRTRRNLPSPADRSGSERPPAPPQPAPVG